MLDLSLQANRQTLAARILQDIDNYCIDTYGDGNRKHLGASELGEPCARKLYYSFRWFKAITHSGRMNRLFDRGNREETRYVEWLRGIGFTVWDRDENGKQFRVAASNRHLGGSMDGATRAYDLPEPFLLEFKTKGTGSEFTKLKDKGVAFVMPKHFIQASVYGKSFGLQYALYFCINKNDDDLHVEVVKLDWQLADQYLKRGEDIVNAIFPPIRISDNPSFIDCKMCDYAGVCHKGVAPDKNCRTCKFSVPIITGDWMCAYDPNPDWHSIIPDDVIPVGCSHYLPVA